ncbi:MAG: hypothetical protein JKY49_14220 [Cohaesibacteraceae bacterium]|nr:hypothetical protein [Cohaesibacteraceae bacterium]MBL4875426.1 hypothetical protein [Cohaesibacteraceae bacterium]
MPTQVQADPGAFLEITLKIAGENRQAAVSIYSKFKRPFLDTVTGAESKMLLVRPLDVQVLHGFATKADAQAYLESKLFNDDVVVALKPHLEAKPEIRIYSAPLND